MEFGRELLAGDVEGTVLLLVELLEALLAGFLRRESSAL